MISNQPHFSRQIFARQEKKSPSQFLRSMLARQGGGQLLSGDMRKQSYYYTGCVSQELRDVTFQKQQFTKSRPRMVNAKRKHKETSVAVYSNGSELSEVCLAKSVCPARQVGTTTPQSQHLQAPCCTQPPCLPNHRV